MEETWKAFVDALVVAAKNAKTSRNPTFGQIFSALSKLTLVKEGTLMGFAEKYGFPENLSEKDKALIRQKLKNGLQMDPMYKISPAFLEKAFNIATAESAPAPKPVEVDPLDQALENFRNFSLDEVTQFLRDHPEAIAKMNAKFKENPDKVREFVRANNQAIVEIAKWNLSAVNYEIANKGLDVQAALHACETGDVQTLEFLLQSRTGLLVIRNQAGLNLLSLACSKGQAKVVKLLLENYPQDLNAEDRHGKRPIEYAAESGSADTVKLLLFNNTEVTRDAFVVAKNNVGTLLVEHIIREQHMSGRRENKQREAQAKVMRQGNIPESEVERQMVRQKTEDFLAKLDYSHDITVELKQHFDSVNGKYKVYALDVMLKTGNPKIIEAISDKDHEYFSKDVYKKQFRTATWLHHKELLEEKLVHAQLAKKAEQNVSSAKSVSAKAETIPEIPRAMGYRK